MIFKLMGMKAAVLATAVVGGIAIETMPAEAMSFSDGGVINFNVPTGSTAQVLGSNLGNAATRVVTGIDFNGAPANSLNPTGAAIQIGSATGGFTPYIGQVGTIGDISFVGGVSGPIANFLTINPDLVFNLDSAVASVDGSTASFTFDGAFANALGTVLGTSRLSTQFDLNPAGVDNASAFSLTAEAEAVPSPALLPGLIGMGVAALRKRKSMGVSDK